MKELETRSGDREILVSLLLRLQISPPTPFIEASSRLDLPTFYMPYENSTIAKKEFLIASRFDHTSKTEYY